MDSEIDQADNAFLSKDRKIRKRVLDTYNKEEEDFESKDDWNAYLEELEDIIFNLVEGIDVEQTERKLQGYRLREAASIETVRARKARREQDAAAAASASRAAANVDEDMHDAAPSPSGETGTGYGTYVPAGMSTATGMAPTAPVPMAKVEMNGEGVIQSKLVSNREQYKKMAAASGWSQDVVAKRALHDAFTSLFIT